MTLSGSSFVGLSSLDTLNRRLAAAGSVVFAAESTAEEGDPFAPTEGEGTEGRQADPNEDTETVPEFRSFSSTNKFEFEKAVQWMNTYVELDPSNSTLIDAFLEQWALKWRDEQGYSTTDSVDTVPTLDDLLADDRFVNGAFWLPATASNQVPSVFLSERNKTLDDGTVEPEQVIGMVDPLEGVQFVTTQVAAQIDPYRSPLRKVFRAVVKGGPRDMAADVITAADENPAAHEREGVSFPEFLDKYTQQRAQQPGGLDETTLPFFSQEELFNLVVDQPAPSGGTTTKRTLKFDRNHLVAQVEDLWHRWMMEPGTAPMGIINGIVDQYIRDAKSFWSGKGGQLDFDTFVKDKLRQQPRYKTVFKHKLPGTTEDQFLASFTQPITQFGQTDKFNQKQGFAAVTSGAGPADQLKRISRTRQVEISGGFSQRLAQTLKGLGVG